MARPPQLLLLDLYVASHLASALLEHELKEAEMSAGEFALYSVLGHEAELTPTELARRLGVPVSSAIFRTGKLIGRGHAERRPNPRDGRSALLALTEDGRAAHAHVRPAFMAALERLLRHLDRPAHDVQGSLQSLAGAASAALAEARDEELLRRRAA